MKSSLRYAIQSAIENLTVAPYPLETIEEAKEEAEIFRRMSPEGYDIEPTPENVKRIWNEITNSENGG